MTAINHMHDADLNLLLALEALLEEGNVTRAAKRVGVTQPAMSHKLERLRELLGDPLFVRTPRGITPTPRAKSLAEPLAHVLADVRRLLSDAEFDPATTTRQFTICTPDVGQLVILPALIEAVRAQAPQAHVQSLPRPPDYLERLETGDIDIVVGGERDLPPQLRKQALVSSRPVVIGRAGHAGLATKLTLERFAALPHIKIAFRDGLGGRLDAVLRERGLTPQFRLTMTDLVTAMFIVARTDLVVVAGEVVARQFTDVLPLRAVPVPIDAPLTISQIWHERQHADPGHVWFRGVLREAVHGAVGSGPRGTDRESAKRRAS